MNRKKIAALIVIIVLIIIVSPYVFVEINTAVYGEQFENQYTQTGMIGDIRYYKVLYVIDNKAKVYYVDEDTGTYVYFVKDGDEWVMSGYDTVWSKYGSASEIPFPYYPH